ncbi:MAG TPA: hypothetical protein VLW54_11020 [Candidatus Acidoferrales bacterium]|nr:hypothetical protein [Candidatus Acidoferrales bacterium]
MRPEKFCLLAGAMCAAALSVAAATAMPEARQSTPTPLVRYLGTIKSIKGDTLVLNTDEGGEVTAVVVKGARMLRVEPGETNLSHAVPLDLTDLETGDRIRIRGRNAPDGKSVYALEVIAIKHLDIAAKQERERADWQKRGIGGLVKSVDAAAKTVTLTVGAIGAARTVTIHTTAGTLLRRYAPGSVQFDEAKAAPLDEIRPGDQLRARGERSGDGADFMAEEIVSGTFRNIAGTITSVDAVAGRIEVMDVLTGKTATVNISAKSQLRKLPPEMAMMLAARLRNASAGNAAGSTQGGGPATQQAGGRGGPGGAAGGPPRGGRGDFQQLVNRLPQAKLSDFAKGEAVLLVGTGSAISGEVTAITILGGVEPLLRAGPRGSQSFTLSPWTIGGNTGQGEESP